jgi:hypothetical protein
MQVLRPPRKVMRLDYEEIQRERGVEGCLAARIDGD